eukprot:TRINITY_DN51827_c0_g1_i1.p1 TRINITY_DN51827_c0_g1~~TRINITY_DN51827_c0_g1_i1.p1  ORF type:complete len:603 (+),score=150.28 TRINITY_DN51827_c0_g1_i1:94-1809(+)
MSLELPGVDHSYEIDKVVAERYVDGARQVKVRWTGWSAEHDEWHEPKHWYPLDPDPTSNTSALLRWEARLRECKIEIADGVRIAPEGETLSEADARTLLHGAAFMNATVRRCRADEVVLQGAAAAGLSGRVAALHGWGPADELWAAVKVDRTEYALVPARNLTPCQQVPDGAEPEPGAKEDSEAKGRAFRLERVTSGGAHERRARFFALQRELELTGQCEAEELARAAGRPSPLEALRAYHDKERKKAERWVAAQTAKKAKAAAGKAAAGGQQKAGAAGTGQQEARKEPRARVPPQTAAGRGSAAGSVPADAGAPATPAAAPSSAGPATIPALAAAAGPAAQVTGSGPAAAAKQRPRRRSPSPRIAAAKRYRPAEVPGSEAAPCAPPAAAAAAEPARVAAAAAAKALPPAAAGEHSVHLAPVAPATPAAAAAAPPAPAGRAQAPAGGHGSSGLPWIFWPKGNHRDSLCCPCEFPWQSEPKRNAPPIRPRQCVLAEEEHGGQGSLWLRLTGGRGYVPVKDPTGVTQFFRVEDCSSGQLAPGGPPERTTPEGGPGYEQHFVEQLWVEGGPCTG